MQMSSKTTDGYKKKAGEETCKFTLIKSVKESYKICICPQCDIYIYPLIDRGWLSDICALDSCLW